MKKVLHVLQVLKLIIQFPFDVEKGSKKAASVRLKKALITAKFL
jgi:hypothetical protein